MMNMPIECSPTFGDHDARPISTEQTSILPSSPSHIPQGQQSLNLKFTGADDDAEGTIDNADDDYLIVEDPDQAGLHSDSADSQRPGKRKHQDDSEDFFRRDPELYGLRRSVRFTLSDIGASLIPAEGRAHQSHRVVCSAPQLERLDTN